jgi:SAM-dependent methyltransferase
VALLFEQRPGMLRPGMRMLHIAPEPALCRLFAVIPMSEYVSGDLTGEFGPQRIDVTDLAPFADSSFDAVVCNHVLEHVPDDRLAMAELRRVLKPGGWALLLVPDVRDAVTVEDPWIADPEEQLRRFGQHDHVRRYGWDYVKRLSAAGFEVTVERPDQLFDVRTIHRNRLERSGDLEPLFLAR